jgi:hypothetical protein
VVSHPKQQLFRLLARVLPEERYSSAAAWLAALEDPTVRKPETTPRPTA